MNGEINIYDVTTQQVTVLNTTASDLWHLTRNHSTVEEITRLMASAYGVSAAAIRDQIVEALGLLFDAGLIEIPTSRDQEQQVP